MRVFRSDSSRIVVTLLRELTYDTAFHYISLGIVSLFLLELLLLMFGLGKLFWRRIIYVVDFVIVLAAFIVEIFLEDIFATFIILFRLWRMVRVMHGIYVSVEENR